MRAAALALAVSLIALPALALAQSADSASSLQTELAALEQEIQELLASASTTSSVSASTSAASSSASSAGTGVMCPSLPRTLSLGTSGPDVSSLQAFLAQQGDFSATATGYFGTVTETSVEAWQSQNGVVSSGDPSSTGYGVVGPKTRAAIEEECGGTASVQSECLPAQPPAEECANGWQPVADQNGCTVYYSCSIPLPQATSSAATSSSTASATTTVTTAAVCPVIQKPSCTGTIEPFGTDSNGCVTSYECVL